MKTLAKSAFHVSAAFSAAIVRVCRRLCKIAIELLAAAVAIGISAIVIAAIYLATQSFATSDIAPLVQRALSASIGQQVDVAIGNGLLRWDNRSHNLQIEFDNLAVRTPSQQEIITVTNGALHVDVLSALRGHLIPRHLALAGTKVDLASVIAKGGNQEDEHHEKSLLTRLLLRDLHAIWQHGYGEHAFNIQKTTLHLAADSPTVEIADLQFSQSGRVRSGNANISVIPRIASPDGRGNSVPAKIQATLSNAQNSTNRDIGGEDIGSAENLLDFNIENVSPALVSSMHSALNRLQQIDAVLSGNGSITFDQQGMPRSAALRLSSGKGALREPSLWDKQLVFNALNIDIKWPSAESNNNASVSSVLEIDGGSKLSARLTGDPSFIWHLGKTTPVSADLKLENVAINSLPNLWPKNLADTTRDWIISHMKNGTFTTAGISLNSDAQLTPSGIKLANTTGNGKLSVRDVLLTYMQDMPPIIGARADATYDLDKITLNVSGNDKQPLRVLPSAITINGLSQNDQFIDIPLNISGDVSELIRLLDMPALNFAKTFNLKQEGSGGTVTGTLRMNFMLKKNLTLDEISPEVNAAFKNLRLADIAPDATLTNGELVLALEKKGLRLNGAIKINDVPMTSAIKVTFPSSDGKKANKLLQEITLSGKIQGDQWHKFGIDSAAENTKGNIDVIARILKGVKQDAQQITLQMDARTAEVKIPPLNWQKIAGKPARLNAVVVASPNAPLSVPNFEINGDNLYAKGSALFDTKSNQLLSLDLPSLITGKTNAALRIVQDNKSKLPVSVTVEGAAFDASALTMGREPGHESAHPKDYYIRLGTLYTSDTGRINDVKLRAKRDSLGWIAIDLEGKAANAQGDATAPVKLSLSQSTDDNKQNDPSKRLFTLASADFGAMLNGMGFTNAVRGGNVEASGSSMPDDPRTIAGKIKISEFQVTGLSFIGRIINSLSLVGLPGLFTGTTNFDALEADFLWKGDTVTLNNLRTTGSSFGLTMSGTVDMNSGDADLQGTIAPLGAINRVLSMVPLVGDWLSGGAGSGIVAVTWSAKGNLADPQIAMNPLSVLTPGFLREMFFGENKK